MSKKKEEKTAEAYQEATLKKILKRKEIPDVRIYIKKIRDKDFIRLKAGDAAKDIETLYYLALEMKEELESIENEN